MAAKRAEAPKQHVPPGKPAGKAAKPESPKLEPMAPPRSYAPRGIAAVLAPVLRPAFRKRAPAAAQLLADWPTLAGPDLAARAAPVKFAAGTLTLACTGPAAMELQLSAPAIIQRLNLGLGSAMVERLRFVQQTPGITTKPPAPTRRQNPHPSPKNLPEGPLGEALAKLHQGIHSKS